MARTVYNMNSKRYPNFQTPLCEEFFYQGQDWFYKILSIFRIFIYSLLLRFFNHHRTCPLEIASAALLDDGFMKNVLIFMLNFNLTSSIIDKRR